MPESCCCYVVDEQYLLPTFVSALQARRHIDLDACDVVIICVGPHNIMVEEYRIYCADAQIKFINVPSSATGDLSMYYARFFIADILQDSYKHVLYIDADTRIAGSLEPLIKALKVADKLMAVADPMCIDIMKTTKLGVSRLEYLLSIGISKNNAVKYFNSGVLGFHINLWREVSFECRQRLATDEARFKFPDQDLLNLVCGDNYQRLSMQWNYPAFFDNVGLRGVIDPRIVHYMSNPRPWLGPYLPWGVSGHALYKDCIKSYPNLKPHFKPERGLMRMKSHIQQAAKKFRETASWANAETVEIIRSLDRSAII